MGYPRVFNIMYASTSNRSNSSRRQYFNIHSISALSSLEKSATISGKAESSRNESYEGYEADTSGVNEGSMHVFVPISTLVLFSVEPIKFAKFLKLRERYELEIEQKAYQLTSFTTVPYKASIDLALLNNLVWMGKLEAVAPGSTVHSLTSDPIKEYLHTRVY